MNIRITIFASFFCFFSIMNAMDDFIPTAQRRKDSPHKEIIIPVDQEKSKPGIGTVPPLDLTTAPPSIVSSDGSQKRTINNLHALKSAASTRLTARRNGASGTTTRNVPTRSGGSQTPSSDNPISQPIDSLPIASPHKAPSILPRAIDRTYSGKILLQEEKTYSESEVWEKLKTYNPALYSFGKKYQMDLDTLESYALFAQEYDVHPMVIAEHIHGSNIVQESTGWQKWVDRIFGSSGDEQRFNRFNEHLEKIKKENPENFGELVLELMKNTADETEGINIKSHLDTMQSKLLTQENSDQLHQIRIQYLAMILQFISGIGAVAWGVYGEVNPSGNITAT